MFIVIFYFVQMGNICCFRQDERTNRTQIWTNSHRHSTGLIQKLKMNSNNQNQYLKLIVTEYLQAFQKIYKNGFNNHHIKGKGVYFNLPSTQSLNKQEFFDAILSSQDSNTECKFKKINKQRFLCKALNLKLIFVEYMMIKYLKSNFIIKYLSQYQSQKHIYLFYNLKDCISLQQIYSKTQLKTQFKYNLENNLKFILAGIILALQELHSFKLVCRSINQKTIVINHKGYPRIIDLSLLTSEGRQGIPGESNHYLSLQQYKNINLYRSVDFWKLGVLIHYIICDSYPNFSLFKQNSFHNQNISSQLQNMVNNLLIHKAQKRLGSLNIAQLKNHAFFNNFDWKQYEKQSLQSPLLNFIQQIPEKKFQILWHYELQSNNFSFLQQFEKSLWNYMIFLEQNKKQQSEKQQILQSSMNQSQNSEKNHKPQYDFHLYNKQYYFLD